VIIPSKSLIRVGGGEEEDKLLQRRGREEKCPYPKWTNRHFSALRDASAPPLAAAALAAAPEVMGRSENARRASEQAGPADAGRGAHVRPSKSSSVIAN